MTNAQPAPAPAASGGLPGAHVMPHAPRVRLPGGVVCIPQHYMTYAHDLATLAAIAARVTFDAHTLVFAAQDDHGLYVQIGLIGRENYERRAVARPRKLVYGRKWRIDADTPGAEIVQTIYLAIKKAREHEVRELFTLRPAPGGAASAALSSHQDVSVLAQSRDWLAHARGPGVTDRRRLQQLLSGLRFAERPLRLQSLHFFGGQAWVEVVADAPSPVRAQEGELAEFAHLRLCVRFDPAEPHQLVYELMDALIRTSDRHVDETFRIDGFARFSRRIDPRLVAQLSIAARPYRRDEANTAFQDGFRRANYATDAARAPQLGDGALAQRNRRLILAHAPLAGHLPRGFDAHTN